MSAPPLIRHATLVARFTPAGWRGVMIEGASGAGKSDLALRLVASGWSLVADDRVLLWRGGEALFGRAPEALAGLMEVRGLGVISHPVRRFAEIVLLARGVAGSSIERMPEPAFEPILDLTVPVFELALLEASAPVKLAQALTGIGLRPQRAYQAVRAGRCSPGVGGVP
jgi:serine kinase of HPr protein (carbohydrate metabolism regulator)